MIVIHLFLNKKDCFGDSWLYDCITVNYNKEILIETQFFVYLT
jgi:hypothetical protein